MELPRPLTRSLTRFFAGPSSVRSAIRVIVVATVVTTLVGGLLVWVLDRDSFSTPGDALWWALQTVTTVGYGDVTPQNAIGRLIGALVLLYSVAFLSILTAAITTSFIEHARRERSPDGEPDITDVLERLDEIASRLDRLERRPGPSGRGLVDAAEPEPDP